MSDDFEAAARHLSRCQLAYENACATNTPTDPVERHEARVRFETIKGELLAAQIRMTEARRAKYGG